jgi:tetratricopeptide (TPR) repeat protein
MRNITFFSLFAILLLCSCINEKYKPNKKSIELNNLAMKEEMTLNHDKAISLLDEAIKIDKEYYLAYCNKATIYKTIKDYQKAIEVYTQISNIYPQSPLFTLYLGLTFELSGDKIKSSMYYEKTILLSDSLIMRSKNIKILESSYLTKIECLKLLNNFEDMNTTIEKALTISTEAQFKNNITIIKSSERKSLIN